MAIIQISIIGPGNGTDFHIGPVMFVDALAFSLATGIGDVTVSGLFERCYPNSPAGFKICIQAVANLFIKFCRLNDGTK